MKLSVNCDVGLLQQSYSLVSHYWLINSLVLTEVRWYLVAVKHAIKHSRCALLPVPLPWLLVHVHYYLCHDFAEFVHFILVSDHALLHSYPTTDNNTSTSMIWVTLNMDRSAANCQGIVGEFHSVCRVVTLCNEYYSKTTMTNSCYSAFLRTTRGSQYQNIQPKWSAQTEQSLLSPPLCADSVLKSTGWYARIEYYRKGTVKVSRYSDPFPKILCRMPFLLHPSQFTRTWDWHQLYTAPCLDTIVLRKMWINFLCLSGRFRLWKEKQSVRFCGLSTQSTYPYQIPLAKTSRYGRNFVPYCVAKKF